MAAFTVLAIDGVKGRSFSVFFTSFMVIFALAGIGNGSTYRMIPAIFKELGARQVRDSGDHRKTIVAFKRQAGAVIGIAGAIGAFGGFLIQVVFRQANLHLAALMKTATTPAKALAIARSHVDWAVPALWVFFFGYIVLATVTWVFYLRRTLVANKIPSMAHESI